MIIPILSFLASIFRDLKGFGVLHLWLSVTSLSFQWRISPHIGSRKYFAGLIDPFPTRFREVSGRRKIIVVRPIPAAMDRNQKIQVQSAA
jgi:hypothetical protein